MDAHHNVEALIGGVQDVPEEMLAELQREIARNQEAVRLVKEREQQALSAKLRAEESHKKMNDMIAKYEDMRRKLELTRMTLAETKTQIELHNQSRSDNIKEAVMQLKERADICTEKLRVKANNNHQLNPAEEGHLISRHGFSCPDPLDLDGGLTEAERTLLALCQDQMANNLPEEADMTKHPEMTSPTGSHREERTRKTNSIYENTVLSLQKRFATKKPHKDLGTTSSVEEQQQQPVEDSSSEAQQEGGASAPQNVEAEESEEFDAREVTMDLNEAVVMMEAKCAGVREKLSQMAVAEQYMRTKQAQLLAKRREREALMALENAARKEREAQEMRKRVLDMTMLLEERRKKLEATETVVDKKAQVVEKVNKILNSKERKAAHVQRQRDECLAFDKVLKKTT